MFRKIVLLICIGALAACASTSGALQTFDQIYGAAITADDIAVTTATAALNSGLISSKQAAAIQKITIDAMGLLNAAQAAFTAGNSLAANQNLAAASATLTALSLCLTQKPLTIATFAACAATIPQVPAAVRK
jgi:hypothetical protein